MRVMGYTPKHAKPAARMDAALSHGLTAINTPSIGRHSATTSVTADVAATMAVAGAEDAQAKAA
jgi:hypothetical protein